MSFFSRPLAVLFVVVLLGACGNPTAGVQAVELQSTEELLARQAEALANTLLVVEVELPVVPEIALPSIDELEQAAGVVRNRLGDVVRTDIEGVEVVRESCEAEGGNLAIGEDGDDVFEADGSGRVFERGEDGAVTQMLVDADGSGRLYSEAGPALLTIDVEPDGTGRFYSRQTDSSLTTVLVNAEGAGELVKLRGKSLTTVRLLGGGAGEYWEGKADTLLDIADVSDVAKRDRLNFESLRTIKVERDGTGQFTLRDGLDIELALEVRADGSWLFTDQNPDRRIELVVNIDGSGTYARRAIDPLAFEFDSDGMAQSLAGQPVQLNVPAAPRLVVNDSFPLLGRLGTLAPPCERVVLRFSETLLFEYGEATVLPSAEQALDDVVESLNDLGRGIQVNGHTDSKGDELFNLNLSRERAEAIASAMRERGITVPVAVNALGETDPVASNENVDGSDNPDGRALNRRVDVVIND